MFRGDRYRNLLLLCVLLGVLVGVFCALFSWAWKALDHAAWAHLPSTVHRLWVTPLAGLIVGLLIHRLGDPGSMATIIRHFHRDGRLPHRDSLPIVPVSVVGLVGGQSAGPEGALTQVGGSLGSAVGQLFRKPHFVRVLTLAGMGAGFGAFLTAPVGGALLWLELLHRRGLEYYEAIIPVLVTSFTAYLVMVGLLGTQLIPPWHVEPYELASLLDLAYVAGIAAVCAAAAFLYAAIFRATGRTVARLAWPIWVRTTVAGGLIGTLGFAFPLSYFYGGQQINTILQTPLPLALLLGTLLAKMLAASLTIKGHFQGGLIVPHLLMGALVGRACATVFPALDPTLAMLTGMAAFNAAATQTPLSSALIVLALTGSSLSVPVFLASLVGYLAGYRIALIEHKGPRTEPPNFHTRRPPADATPAGAESTPDAPR